MSGRARVWTLGVIVLVTLLGTVSYIYSVRREQTQGVAAAPPMPTGPDLTAVTSGPHVVFRSTAAGGDYGRVAVVPLGEPAGPRAFTPAACDRVYARRSGAVCLYAKPGLVTTYRAQVLGPDWSVTRELPLSGVPSRTRLSRDGSLVATTTFVAGHSYSTPGQFSTETLVTRVADGHSTNIEHFQVIVGGKRVTAADRNLWGVTFADGPTFYATAASGGKTWLVRGSLGGQRLVALRDDAECPSLSPDGTRIAFKTRAGQEPGHWRIAVYDIATGRSTILAEQRSVDDQIEWLDDTRVIYGLPRAGEGPSTSDLWTVRADGGGVADLFIRDAWSPAVVR
ncbi:TolB family protein [Micromonospora purpureochromogenes]|uniref:TolB family protein n=1 Tax=Micromonospora purpureochromogenes TaxID=47872 RepID=UPI0036321EC9